MVSSRTRALNLLVGMNVTGELPHMFLLRVSQGQAIEHGTTIDKNKKTIPYLYQPTFEERIDAAKAAAAYFAPKLSTVEVIKGMPDDELDAIIVGAAAEAKISISFGGEGQTVEVTASAKGLAATERPTAVRRTLLPSYLRGAPVP